MDSADDTTRRAASAISSADEICWALAPIDDPLEDLNLLMVPEDHLFGYACELRGEMRILRTLLHEALSTIARQGSKMGHLQTRLRDLIEALRTARDEASDLRARQRRHDVA